MDAASVTNDQSSSSSIPGDQSETGNKNVDQSGNRQTSGRDSTSAGSPVHRDVVIETSPGDEIAVKSTSEISEDGQRKSRQSSEIDEYDEMYASLARFSVLILGNLATINDKETSRLCREVLCKSGAIHNLWCTLLCSGGPLKFSITVPTVYALTKLSCTEWKPFPTHGVLLNVSDKTAALLLTGDCLEVRNDNWTFESIRTQLPVNVSEMDEIPLGWYYEVTLKSSSIMQVGWASKHCHFSPEKGLGVGDDIHSYAFDGGRCKVWNGPITEQMNNDYGTEWRDGDIVSCLLCSDGSLSFWLNGVDCGVAFRDIDLGEAWYPACSLSTDQQIRFNFGATPFRNKMPDGFVPVNAVSQAGSYLDKRNADDSVPDLSGQSATTKPSMAWWVPLDNESESHDQEQPTEVAPEAGDDQDQPISSHSALNDILNRSFSPIGIDVTSDFGDNHHYSPISSGVRYDGAGDSQYPPMDDNIIVDIEDEELSLQDGGGDQPCEPVNIDFMNDNADHGVYPPINTSLTDEDGAGDDTAYRPTVKDIADVGGGQAESHPPPSLYFEICLTCNDQRPLSFGFRNMDDSQSVQALVCPDDTMLMPDGDKVKFSHQHQLILGCGLLLPPGACFFTINGQPIKFLYTFYDEEIGQGPLLPYISDPYLHLNVGDTYFMYEAGNEREIRLGMAALLHDYHESRILAHAAL
ncbi:uncharacterized protein [Ptychodera flava]|uniref:uncharacterized protein n=1 Tax=Ptychodera flava TaxID=63121 RepID=UPI00396AAC22